MAEYKAQFTAYTSSPLAFTANNSHPGKRTCAAPKEIAFGTKIIVSGTGTRYDGRIYTVTDRGDDVKIVNGRYIFDLWMATGSECRLFGRRNGTATVTTKKESLSQSTYQRDIVDVAVQEIGTSETNKGHMKYINWYGGFGERTKWCAIFVSWCANQAMGNNAIVPKYSYCQSGKQWFEERGLFKYKNTYTPKRGDIIFFNYSHTGIVESTSHGMVHTIEGNTGTQNVARRNRSLNDKNITGYGTPNYQDASAYSPSDSGTGNSGSNGSVSSTAKKESKKDTKEEAKKKAKLELEALKRLTKQVSTPMEDMTDYKTVDKNISTTFEFQVLIDTGKKKFFVPVEEGAELKYERTGQPGTFTFTMIPKKGYGYSEGNSVLVLLNNKKIFYGFIFRKQRTKEGMIQVTAYDQIRYLKNQDILIYNNKSTDELIQMIAKSYQLKVGKLAKTGYRMSKVEEDSELYEMILNSLEETILQTGKTYVFYDEVGKLRLENISNMKVNWVISKDTAEDFDYESSIDQDFYNQVKVVYKDDETGVANLYVTKSQGSQNKFGVLQVMDDIPYNLYELGKLKAKVLLEYYNRKRRTLTVSGVIGNISVRGGSLLPVLLELGDITVQNYMMVEKVTHKFGNQSHTMDVTLVGGEFVE